MNDIVRPSSLFGAAAAASLPSSSVGTVHNPPPEVAQLANGTTLRGVVQGQDGKGHLLVRTELGLLQIATKAALAPSTEVVLQIRSSGGQLHVLLMHAEAPGPRGVSRIPPALPQGLSMGSAPAPGQGGAAAGPQPIGAVASSPQGQFPSPHATADVLALGQSVRAIVQAPPAAASVSPGGASATPQPDLLPRLDVGSRVDLRILSVASPGGSRASMPAEAVPSSLPNLIAANRFGAYTAAQNRFLSAAAPGAAGPAPSGTAASAGAPSVGPPIGNAATANVPAPPTSAALLQGVVLSVTHANQPVVQTPVGTLTLEVTAPLPPGSRIAFEILTGGQARPAAQALAPAPTSPATLAHGWPALEEALQALQDAAAPQIGASPSLPVDIVAQPGPRLASGLLFFLSALGAGDLGRWFGGQALQGLRNAGRDALVQRLTRDFGQLGRMAEAAPGDWRLLAMPILDGHHIQQIRLWLRQHRDEDRRRSQKRDREATRFVLEVELSELGDLQLDGLVRGKHFDLMLRSRCSLPSDMRREIVRIFDEANAIGGYSGSVGFQASADWQFLSLDRFDDGAPALVV